MSPMPLVHRIVVLSKLICFQPHSAEWDGGGDDLQYNTALKITQSSSCKERTLSSLNTQYY